jgi:hypothetical protein
MDKTQSHYHSDWDLENNERGMMTITSHVDQNTNLNVYLLARQILGLNLPKFSGEAREWLSFVTTYRHTTDNCQFTESENMERLRKSFGGKARQCVKMMILTNNAEQVIAILRKNYGNSDVILNELIEEKQQQCPVTESRHFQEFANAVENLECHICQAIWQLRSCWRSLSIDAPEGQFVVQKQLRSPNIDQSPGWASKTKLFLKWRSVEKTKMKDIVEQITLLSNVSRPFSNENNKQCGICRSGEHKVQNCEKLKRQFEMAPGGSAETIFFMSSETCSLKMRRKETMCNEWMHKVSSSNTA